MNLPSLLSLALVAAGVSISGAAADLPALRILLVDDDLSDNNHHPGDSRLSPSDRVFRQLVADAVGRDAKAWEVETVKPYASGPGIERLRPFPLVVWYTGASYGGNPDNTAVLSIQDEKTVRRYLEEVGGAVILVSPGYLGKVLAAGSTGDKANWPFLGEVMGVRGGVGLAQRFAAGTVTAPGGGSFKVGKGSPTVESQFSTINPEGAVAVFTASLVAATKKSAAPAPVAIANPYGRGRIVYVGFTFENLADADLAPAFRTLLAAAGPQASPTPRAPVQRQAAAADLGPLTVQVSGTPVKTIVSWTLPSARIVNAQILGPGQSATKASAAPAPGPTVKVERQDRYGPSNSYYWTRMAVEPGASQVVDATPPGTTQRYRVTVTDPSGATGSKEVQHTVPSAQDPQSLAANVQGDGSIILSWPQVPGVTKYRVQTTAPTRGRMEPVIVDGATQWRSPPLDGTKRFWAVTSLYEWNGELRSLTTQDTWPLAITEGIDQYYLTSATLTIHTGNDNKEILSGFEIKLYINGGAVRTDNTPTYEELRGEPWNPHRLQQYGAPIFGSKEVELKVNSSTAFDKTWSPDTVWAPALGNLAAIQQHGLRIVIKYLPNFFLDAWKIDRVTLTVNFQNVDQISNYRRTGHRYFSPGMENRTMTFNVARLLTASANQIDLIANGALQPQ